MKVVAGKVGRRIGQTTGHGVLMVSKIRAMCAVGRVVLVLRMLMILVLVGLVLLLKLGQIHLHGEALVRVAIQHGVLALLRVCLIIHAKGVVRGRLGPRRTVWRRRVGIGEAYAAVGYGRASPLEVPGQMVLLIEEELSGSLLEPKRTIGHQQWRAGVLMCLGRVGRVSLSIVGARRRGAGGAAVVK